MKKLTDFLYEDSSTLPTMKKGQEENKPISEPRNNRNSNVDDNNDNANNDDKETHVERNINKKPAAKKSLINDEVTNDIASKYDNIKELMDKLREAVPNLIDILGNYPDNDYTPEQMSISTYLETISMKLDELDKEANHIEKENNVSNIL